MSSRAEFLARVRSLTGRDEAAPVEPPASTALARSPKEAAKDAEKARATAAERSAELFDDAARAAEEAGWTVHRLEDIEMLANRIIRICREREITSTLTSGHDVIERGGVRDALNGRGISSVVLNADEGDTKGPAFSAGAGITGTDWFIAESGTLVLHPGKDLSRLVSLAPPVHIAVVEPGQVLPTLDELFAIEQGSMLGGNLAGSVNLVSGPSRTGDIEATIVRGIHGPVETHLVMIG